VSEGGFLHIDIKNANQHTNANFKLKVYAVKTYDCKYALKKGRGGVDKLMKF